MEMINFFYITLLSCFVTYLLFRSMFFAIKLKNLDLFIPFIIIASFLSFFASFLIVEFYEEYVTSAATLFSFILLT